MLLEINKSRVGIGSMHIEENEVAGKKVGRLGHDRANCSKMRLVEE
jgi:hypothetical protein